MLAPGRPQLIQALLDVLQASLQSCNLLLEPSRALGWKSRSALAAVIVVVCSARACSFSICVTR